MKRFKKDIEFRYYFSDKDFYQLYLFSTNTDLKHKELLEKILNDLKESPTFYVNTRAKIVNIIYDCNKNYIKVKNEKIYKNTKDQIAIQVNLIFEQALKDLDIAKKHFKISTDKQLYSY